jgi:hypothetical protein
MVNHQEEEVNQIGVKMEWPTSHSEEASEEELRTERKEPADTTIEAELTLLLEVAHEVEEMASTTMFPDRILRENTTLMFKKMETIMKKEFTRQEVVPVAEE